MIIHKIKSKYCTDEKVQIMFSNAPKQIICSKDGYIYLREKNITIHRYLNDPIRERMPYHNVPSSKTHATHLFEYNKLYVKYTCDRYMSAAPRLYLMNASYNYYLSFLYFIKLENNEALCAEFDLEDFVAEEEQDVQYLLKQEVEDFLYGMEGFDAKCVFKDNNGIEYAKFKNESYSIDKKFLDFSDERIIRKYNSDHTPYRTVFSLFNDGSENKGDDSWKATTIDEVKDVNLTASGGYIVGYQSLPVIITIKDDEVYVYKSDVTFMEKNCFKVASTKRKIIANPQDILKKADTCTYTSDPDFL